MVRQIIQFIVSPPLFKFILSNANTTPSKSSLHLLDFA